MARHIDADRLLGEMDKRYNKKRGNVPDNLAEGFLQMEILIKKQPTADVVEVVRCLECVHCDSENRHCDHPMGTTLPIGRKETDFCSYGKKVE